MAVEQSFLESIAKDVRRRAGIAPDDHASAADVALALVGPDGLVIDNELRGPGYVVECGNRFQIVFRLEGPDVRFRLMHECGHVAIRSIGLRLASDDEERAANYVAAAIIAPAELVRRAHKHFGERPRRIAKVFGLSQTAMVLRLAEVVGDERGVVTTGRSAGRRNVLVRNANVVDWSDPEILNEADRRERLLPGLAKTHLLGGIDEGRVAFRVK